ncbi:unnamed protein product [Rhodiola kirilowii]
MSDKTDVDTVVTSIIPVSPKITDHKLVGSNYLDWSKTIKFYLRSIRKSHHLTDDPKPDDEDWSENDARLFIQIKNSIDTSIVGLINHCEYVNELMEYLRFVYASSDDMSRIFNVCKAFYHADWKDLPVKSYFMQLKQTFEELNELLPFSTDIKVQRTQREQMFVVSFLCGLGSEYESVTSQILSSAEIPSANDALSRVLRGELSTLATSAPVLPGSSALVGHKTRYDRPPNRSTRESPRDVKGTEERGKVVCYYCHEPGHTKRTCVQLQNKLKRNQFAHAAVASDSSSSTPTYTLTAEEYAKFQALLSSQQSSSSITAVAESGISNTCLISSSPKWVIDSGATDHMTGNFKLFSHFSNTPPSSVTLADGTISNIIGFGTTNPTTSLSLSSVQYVPGFAFNLLSVRQLTRSLNCSISFFPDHCLFQDLLTKQIIGSGHESGGLYVLDTHLNKPIACPSISTPFHEHCRLGHPSLSSFKQLRPHFHSLSHLDCESCRFAKHHRTPSAPRVNKRSNFPFELVHSDVWGPCSVLSKSGFRYFVTFVDDFSRTTWLYLMKSRSELFTHFVSFCAEIKTQFNVSLHTLRSDNAKEYFSGAFQTFMLQNGILHQSSCVDTPSQNGVAERKNRHLLETARALLFQTHVPKHFWADAILTACYLINRMPSSVLQGATPYGTLFPNKPLFHIAPRIFGSTCFVRDVRPHVTKLDPKALKCVFLGYSRLQKGYRCFCPSLDKYLVSSDVTFVEHLSFFPTPSHSSTSSEDVDDVLVYEVHQLPRSEPTQLSKPPIVHVYSRRQNPPASDPVPESVSQVDPPESTPPDSDLPIALRKGKRSCTYPISAFVSYNHLSPSSKSFIASLDSTVVPKTLTEALSHPDWRNAMIEEMNALDANCTWDLVSLPVGKKCIGCRWVYTVKVNSDGSVARLKARLVAKGYAQTYGNDYSDTFSPVAKMTSIRLIISLAACSDWPLHQLDIKNAFLHGDLDEEVYIEQPPGFVAQGESVKVCRLRKSLYGLKQSPRAWFGKFSQVIEKFGMNKCKCDHSVFYKHSPSGIILLVVYVDDIVITGSDYSGIASLKTFLHGQFNTKDLGALKYFLGIEVTRCKKGIFLSQRKYFLDLLLETGKSEARPCSAPMIPNLHFTKEGVKFDDPGRYRRLVGKLNYLTVTRPDIAYSVSVLSQYMASPTIDHWKALEQILCYLKGTPGQGMIYKNHGHFQIECFSDADWAGDKDDRRSTTGYCVFVGGNLVSWKSKKQHVISRSSAESEYRAMSQSVCEIVWIRQLLSEIGFKITTPAKLWCDNQAALHIASNPVFHERTKHIEVDCHFIREKLADNTISTAYVTTNEQLGDIFTKALNGVRVNYMRNKLGMINIYAPT